MPQRFLRPGLRNSERWNRVSFGAQSLYVRLLTLVDDYGRYDGRMAVIWSECFAIWNDLNPKLAITPQESAGFCSELLRIGMVDFYEIEGRKCLQVSQWQERVRDGSKEKWPANTREGNPPVGAPPLLAVVKSIHDEWNALGNGLPQCLVVSDKRRRMLEVRLRDNFFIDNWRQAMERLKTSEFCKGDNERGWKATFDWFIQPDSVAKIMENKYHGTRKSNTPANPRNANSNQGRAHLYANVGKNLPMVIPNTGPASGNGA
jgi:hypothetical protein